MKKGIKNLAIATMVGVASMGMLTGCKSEEKEDLKPYIQVSGLDVAYIQNEDINLEGAKVLYYSDKNDKTADEINLKDCMISNLSTEETGNKIMKVFFNGCELEINYKVMSASELVDLYNAAYDNFWYAQNIHADMVLSLESEFVSMNVLNNKYYATDGTKQQWIQKENDDWYNYSIEGQTNKKSVMVGVIAKDNIKEYAFESIINLEDRELNVDIVNEFTSWEYDINGHDSVITFKQNGVEGVQETKLTIKNEKFVKVEHRFFEEDGVTLAYDITSTISYNAEDVNMVELPNIEWTEN